MRRIVTSDWQLCDNARDRYRTDFVVNQIPKLIEKYKPDQLLVLGDLTEAKDNHPASLVNEMVDFFCSLAQSFEIEIIVLQGNHDFLHNGHPFFKFIENYRSLHWIARPEVLDNCLYLPHTRNYKRDWKGIDFKSHDYIFAHNIFEGVKANGQKLSGIPTRIFPDGCCVISGDVHEPQSFDLVTYVGAPFLCDFGDSYDPRVLLLDGLKIKSIKVGGPQKRLIEVFWKEGMQFRRTGDFNPGDIVKVKSYLEMEHVAHWDRLRSHLSQWLADQGAIVSTIIPVVTYAQGARAEPIGQRKSDKQYFDAFVSRNGIDERSAAIGKEIVDLCCAEVLLHE